MAVQISAKSDYAVRAALEMAARAPDLLTIDAIVQDQGMPRKFVEAILGDLRRAGIVRTQRGCAGGYTLAKPASEIAIGDILRAVDGPLAEVRGLRPHETTYGGVASHLPDLWVAVRSSLRQVLDEVTVQQLLTGALPAKVRRLNDVEDAWLPR
ncbi:Rrf2 family transcriptional regulator [Branchiibius hedensis]|uniref:RrF2 family transcriptional regulator n=1 Tax=Branchiibius hedensis TaxID=672460 RepID=UPI00319EA462